MSSVDPIVHFGLGARREIAQVEVLWPDGNYSSLENLSANQRYEIIQQNSKKIEFSELSFPLINENKETMFEEVSLKYGINYVHNEKPINDFAFQPLLLRKVSENGPSIVVGDVNGDELEDFIVGSSFEHSPVIFFQTNDSKFKKVDLFQEKEMLDYEVESMALFDLENDGDLDLYLV